MKEISTENREISLSGIIKTTLAYGFVGFAAIIVLYVIMNVFWAASMMNILYSIGLVQTYIMVLFVQFSAGFFAQIAIYRRDHAECPEADGEPGSLQVKFSYYGLLGGLFTGVYIFLFPTVIILLASFSSSGLMHSLTNIFNNFFPFVISGLIGGVAGSYYAGSLLKKGFPGGEDPGRALQEKFACFALTALLIVFVPLFFGLATAHFQEPEVISYGEYNSNNLVLLKIDPYGNRTWETDPITTTNTQPGIVLEMENGSYALFGYEFSTHGNLNTLTYVSEDGTISDPIPFLRSDGETGSPVEIPGSGFLISYYGKNILALDYNGSITGQYSIPESLKQNENSVKIVPVDGNKLLISRGVDCAFMDSSGNISGTRSFAYEGYTGRPYKMTINDVTPAYNGGYILCIKDDKSGDLKAIWLDDNLNTVKEETIGTSHASCISIDSGSDGNIIIVRDVDRPEDNPADYKEYFHIYYPDSGTYHDVMTGNSFPEIFVDGNSGYTLFSVRDKWLSDERELVMETCDFDETCSDPIKLLEGELKGVKTMQTSDGGYLIAYLSGGEEE
ncbi:hypothetical protein [Methanolacinia paynteri]|uniref:hypothetical protein n=1 Tax=Methanolacinia paynteri TaxID=230356 RepID=UPI00064FF735|nr:hypothetical protein [Methanolacinia paynteri]